MADAVQSLVLDALQRAAADPGGAALIASKGTVGLFASSAAGRRAAQKCKDDGLLCVTRTETRGKSQLEYCAVTDKGMAFLLDSVNPRGVLEAMLHALDACRSDQAELVEQTRHAQTALDGMHANLVRVLSSVEKSLEGEMVSASCRTDLQGRPAAPLAEIRAGILEHLERWRDCGSLDDCPLPELFQRLENSVAGLTIGLFHDALRDLHEQERVFLHPWTGPLYELPEPALALLAGHEIAYYASLRGGMPEERTSMRKSNVYATPCGT